MSEKYLPFFRKYRPQKFSDLIGQEALVKALSNAIELNRIANAYLFCGPRGTGKTSSARIFAKSLNCAEGISVNPCQKCASCIDITNASGLDVIEIDAASNRGIDDAKELISQVQYAPINGRFKIFIIDEVHMLSKDAFNALLKTFEEPPKNVIFILATTEPHKVLETIVSRCQRYDFRRITIEDIVAKLKEVANLEKIKITDDALFEIAKSSNGGMRDSLALLDQVAVLGLKEEITREEIESLVGKVSFKPMFELVSAILSGNTIGALDIANELLKKGSEPRNLTDNLIDFLKNAIIVKSASSPDVVSKFTTLVKQDIQLLNSVSENFEADNLSKFLNFVINFYKNIKSANNPYIWLELLVIQGSYGAYKSIENQIQHLPQTPVQLASISNVQMSKKEPVVVQAQVPQVQNAEVNMSNVELIPKQPAQNEVRAKVSEPTPQPAVPQKPQAPIYQTQPVSAGNNVWEAILACIESPVTNAFYKQMPQVVKLEGEILTLGFINQNTLNRAKTTLAVLQNAVSHVLSDSITISLTQVPKGEKVISFPSGIEVNSSPVQQELTQTVQKDYSDDTLPEADIQTQTQANPQSQDANKTKAKNNNSIYSEKTKNYLDVFNGKMVD